MELKKIDMSISAAVASFGSILVTDKAIFFISVPLGKLTIKEKEIYAISISSPLAKIMIGQKPGNEFNFLNRAYKILHLY